MPNLVENLQRASWLARLSAIIESPKKELGNEDVRKWLAVSFDELTRPVDMFSIKRGDSRIPASLIVGVLQTYCREWSKMFIALGELGPKLADSSCALSRGELGEIKKFARLMRKYLLDARPMA